jgi:hypothetical protein
MEGNLGTSGRALNKPRPICLKLPTIIYLTHARMLVWPDSSFLSAFIVKRDMPGTATEEEKVYLECK